MAVSQSPGYALDWNKFTRFRLVSLLLSVLSQTHPKHAQLLMTSALSFPDSLHWDNISEIDLDALIPKMPSTKATIAG